MKYYVATSKNQIKHLNSKQINNVNVKEDILTFETNTKSLNKLLEDINNISYYNKRKIRILIFIKKYIVSIISIIILLFFIVNEQFVIKKNKVY